MNNILTVPDLLGQAQTLGDALTTLNQTVHTTLAAVHTHNAQPGAVQLNSQPLQNALFAIQRAAGMSGIHLRDNTARLTPGAPVSPLPGAWIKPKPSGTATPFLGPRSVPPQAGTAGPAVQPAPPAAAPVPAPAGH